VAAGCFRQPCQHMPNPTQLNPTRRDTVVQIDEQEATAPGLRHNPSRPELCKSTSVAKRSLLSLKRSKLVANVGGALSAGGLRVGPPSCARCCATARPVRLPLHIEGTPCGKYAALRKKAAQHAGGASAAGAAAAPT
jgi:hypothetical protein